MRIAIPVAGGNVCPHFGHCEAFALIDVEAEGKTILGREEIAAPDHQPGLLPRWLAERGANLIIAGGMGSRARALFREQGIDVITGASMTDPESIVRAYLEGNLETGANICDH